MKLLVLLLDGFMFVCLGFPQLHSQQIFVFVEVLFASSSLKSNSNQCPYSLLA